MYIGRISVGNRDDDFFFLDKGSNSGKLDVELSISHLEIAEIAG